MKTFFLSISLWLVSISLCGQATSLTTIKLINAKTGEPVAFAHYVYGGLSGATDEKGQLTFSLLSGEKLFISHLEFGPQTITAEQLGIAVSQGTLALDPDHVFTLQPVQVSAIRPADTKSSFQPLNAYDKVSHDATAYLQQYPSFTAIRKSGNYGFDPVFRGFKYDQLNIVVNGQVSAMAACPNRMDPSTSQVSMNQVEKVEIFKGPHQLRYAPSIGGTIHFMGEKPRFSASAAVYGRLTSSYESNGGIGRGEAMLGLGSQAVDIRLHGSYSQGGDYQDGLGQVIPSSFRRGSWGLNAAAKLNEHHRLNLYASNNRAKDTRFAALGMDLRKDNTWLYEITHEYLPQNQAIPQWKTSLFYSSVDHLMDNLLKNLNPRMMNMSTAAETVSLGGRTEAQFNFTHWWGYAGLDFKREQASGDRIRAMLLGPMAGRTFTDNVWQDGEVNRTGVFVEAHHPLGVWVWTTSARLDVNIAEAAAPSELFNTLYDSPSATQLNPSISSGITREFSDQLAFGAWIGRSLRSGSITERFIHYLPVGLDPFELVGNPALAPEKNNQVDLNLRYQSKAWLAQINLFGAYLQDFISSEKRADLKPYLGTSPGVRQFINLEEALMAGFELELQTSIGTHMFPSLSLAYTYGQDLVHSAPLAEIPPVDVRLQLKTSWLENRLTTLLQWRHVEEQNRVSVLFGENTTPGFNLLDFTVNYQLIKNLKIIGGVQNLLDAQYYEHLTRNISGTQGPIYSPGRNMFLTMRLDF